MVPLYKALGIKLNSSFSGKLKCQMLYESMQHKYEFLFTCIFENNKCTGLQIYQIIPYTFCSISICNVCSYLSAHILSSPKAICPASAIFCYCRGFLCKSNGVLHDTATTVPRTMSILYDGFINKIECSLAWSLDYNLALEWSWPNGAFI